jgi:hypothetical protein
MGFENFVMHFKNESLFQNMVHIDDFLLLGNTQVVLGILSSCLVYQLFFSHLNNSFFKKKKSLLVSFNSKIL